jgi:2'-5' RNA ligase
MSESQKAAIAVQLTMANKNMGITVFTDDEIRDITYGFTPLSDAEKVPIGAPERISVDQPPELGADGEPIPQAGQPKPVVVPGAKPTLIAKPKPVLKAASDRDILRVLETAIRSGDRETVASIIGLATYKYGSVQAQLPPTLADRLIGYGLSIADDDIDTEAGGRETDAHVTIKYGLTAPDASALGDVQVQLNGRLTALKKAQSLSFTLGKSKYFAGADNDVVYVDVKGEDLAAVHRAISAKLPCAPSSHPTYQPHATVAYVKSGTGQKYTGWDGLDGMTVYVEYVTLSDADGNRVEVSLG